MADLRKMEGNVVRVNHEELTDILRRYYKVRKRAIFVLGKPGIGKSMSVQRTAQNIAKELGLEFSEDETEDGKFGFIDERLSQMDATDLKGIPFKEDGETKWLPPEWLPKNPDSKGIIFLDEMNLATPIVQSAAYSLILDRKIGDYRLPDGWLIVAAGNRMEDMANIYEMAKPLQNRFGWCELMTPDIDSWKEWAIDYGIDKRIISFLCWKPSNLMKFNPEKQSREELKQQSFATPRTWEFCSDLTKGISNINKLEMLTSTTVGQGVAMEYIGFLKVIKKIPFKQILKKPEKIEELQKTDQLYSMITALATWYKKHYEKKHLRRICQICQYLRGDFAALLLRYCHDEHPQSFTNKIKKIPEWKNTLAEQHGTYIL